MAERLLTFLRFQRNATLYLQSISMSSLAQGAYGVIQGLYIISLGFDETVLGTILSTRMLAAAIASVPAGVISDRLGRKPALVAGGLLTTVGYLGMAVTSSSLVMIVCSCIVGLAQACQMTSGAPLLAESSTQEDRARLFGVNFSLSMFVSMVGSLLGGFLPRQLRWLGQATAFRFSLALFSIVTLIGVLPAFKIVEDRRPGSEVWLGRRNSRETEPANFVGGYVVGGYVDEVDEVAEGDEGDKAEKRPAVIRVGVRKASAVLQVAWEEIRSLAVVMRNRDVTGLLAYNVLIGFGAGLVIPFFNVFLSGKLGVDTAVIGLILSFTHGATAIAGLIAPVLATRYGKVKTVVGTQVASIPFLILIALPPNVYLVSVALFVRSALMNMSNPVASTFSMEIVEPDKRGKISSLMRISDNISRAFSAAAAGYVMSRWSYEAPYFFTAVLYLLASFVYWRSFRGRG